MCDVFQMELNTYEASIAGLPKGASAGTGPHGAVPVVRGVNVGTDGKIKCGRIVKRASGWYLCLFIDAEPKAIQAKKNRIVGIDPGFKNNLTTTEDELDEIIKSDKKKRFEEVKTRLAQAHKKEKIKSLLLDYWKGLRIEGKTIIIRFLEN